MRRPRTLILAAVTGAALLAGCSDDDDGQPESGGPTKAEFIARADAICTKGDRKIDERAGKFFPSDKEPSQRQVNDFATEVAIPGTRQQIAQIRELEAPDGDEKQIEELLAQVDRVLDRLEEDPSALASGDPFADVNKLARAYGLKACGG